MNNTTFFEKYCGSCFWDSNLTWYTATPDFTPCFQKTILVWVPCLFLWIFTSIEVYYIKHSKYKDIPWNFLNISKLLLTFILIVLSITDLVLVFNKFLRSEFKDALVYIFDICVPVVRILSFILSSILLLCNRKRGLQTSGLQFLFWLLILICGIPQLGHHILDAIQHATELNYKIVSFIIFYAIAVLIFLLNCFADQEPRFNPYPVINKQCPEEGSTSFLSRILFVWFFPFAWKGFKRALKADDLWDLGHQNSAREVVQRFEKFWLTAVQKVKRLSQYPRATYKLDSASVDFVGNETPKQVSVLPALCKAFAPMFLFGAALKLLQDILTFVNPQILKLLITFIEKSDYQWKGYLYAACLFITATLQTLISAQYTHRMYIVGMRVRTALVSTIYKKALTMSSSAKKERTTGEIVNLMAVDSQQFVELMAYINLVWSAPLQIILCLYFLWDVLGISVLAGVAVMIILIPINGAITKRAQALQIQQMQNKDERIKIMNEVLNGIKVLKLYAWEPSFQNRILKIRGKEIKTLKKAAYFNAGMSFIWSCAPFLVALLTFVTFIQSSEENQLTPQIAFVALTLFSTLHFVMGALPLVIVWIVETWVSVKRINKFLNCDELDSENVQHYPTEKEPIVIEKGSFSWDTETILKNINIRFEENSLTAIVGGVGSGKSSLISAILGEMTKNFGRVNTLGSIAYVSQKAWVQNATIRDNILFGRKFDKRLYDQVIEACALKPDLAVLSAGDKTEIGEKGINLSGGQKQRIAIARAIYYNADIYLLDDPLSAVDIHVGKHIFDRVLGPRGLLKHTTRVLVTHAATYLPLVDKIVVLKQGQISEVGSYQQLLDKKCDFSEFLMQHVNLLNDKEEAEDKATPSPTSETPALSRSQSKDENAELVEEETVETGSVKWSVYKYYFKSVGIVMSISAILLMVLFQVCNVGSNIWLSVWSVDKDMTKEKRDWYLGIYGALGVGQALTTFLAAFAIFMGCLNGAHFLHNFLLKNVLRAPCNTFFDVTPTGRILNRFSKDIDTLDMNMPMLIRGWINCLFAVIATLFVISYTTPVFLGALIPIAFVYYFVQRFYIATSRQLKRLEAVSRSPIYSHFSETIEGAACIRAYGERGRFIKESETRIDFNQACYYPSRVANRWLAIRLEMIGNVIILCAALFAVLGKDQDPGLVGLSITYALQITQTLNWLVISTSDLENDVVSVERIKEYGEVPSEAPWELPNKTLPSSWPEVGAVEFRGFGLRYRSGLEMVLKDLNFSIRGGEKVGIVGRTGAGKSSLTVSLFRIVEAALGEIIIDGINICEIGLHALRSRLTIIPQDAVLFAGNLRLNLDPYEVYTDDDIWKVLELSHLREFVKGLTAGLNHEISEGGENLSAGQRQLVCLTRALLRKTKVLILDEATASVDLETDDLIQKTIGKEFRDCTILTIAHRLNTIMNSDRIIVLDKGKIVEFDSPSKLLQNRSSIFYSMAKDAGLV